MTNRILAYTLTAAALFIFAATRPLLAADGKHLNVLLIVSDDLNCSLGCYGDGVVKTPNIDRLASRGVRFDRSYCNYPVCNASRTSFLSGRYPETTGVLGNATQPRVKLGPDFQFLPEYFRANGYFTAGIGKIAHGSFPGSIKWDVFAEPMRGVDEDELPGAKAAGKKGGKKGKKGKKGAGADEATAAANPENVPFGWSATENKDEDEPDGITATKIVKLLEEHSGKDKPFFIAAGFHKPHVPHTAPKKYFEMYPPTDMPTPVEPTDHSKSIPAIAHPPKYFPDLQEIQKKEIISHYHAATTFMDSQVGRVLEAVDRLKLWDDTVIVFLGDHGWHLGEHDGFWAKSSIMEESARAPLIVAAPGAKSGAACARMVEFVDIFPTLTDLCGLSNPAGLEGLSFAPVLADPARPWKKAVFTVVTRGTGPRTARTQLGHGVRTEQYTYLEWPDGSTQLYDHTQDAKEYFNLAKDPKFAQTVADMKQLLKDGPKAARPPGI